MRRNEQVWLVSATVLSLSAFSFFAGLGLRGLYERVRQRDVAANPILGARFASAAPRRLEPDAKPGQLFWEVMQKLRIYYVEPLPSNNALTIGSVEAMLNSLKDPNTRLLSRAEVESLRAAGNGDYAGMGAVLAIRPYRSGSAPDEPAGEGGPRRENPGVRTLVVVSVMPGSPAEKAGLQAGDHITEVDGKWIAPIHVSYRLLTQLTDDLGPQDGRPREPGETVEPPKPDPNRDRLRQQDAADRARWRNATELPAVLVDLVTSTEGSRELTYERGTPAKVMKTRVQFGRTRVEPVRSRTLNATTGYVQVLGFSPVAKQQVAEALAGFQRSGVRSLVLDLRQSPGGNLEVARDIAGMLLGDVKFATLRERNAAGSGTVDTAVPIPGAQVRFRPAQVSVLVDKGTAGAAELLAAALRDHAGARLVGTSTFGDGTEQEVFDLGNGAGFSITRARMLTSRGVDFEGTGLKADVAPQGDPIEAAVRALTAPAGAGGRPGAQGGS